MTAIDNILEEKQKEIFQLENSDLLQKARTRRSYSFQNALSKNGISLIAEVKRSSPSAGDFDINPNALMKSYIDAGADALSILSDKHFGMNVGEFEALASKSKLPVLRKDFILSKKQVLESWILGADAVLLIASFLDSKKLDEFGAYAEELGLDVLYEVHSTEELKSLPKRAKIIGINNRNLKDAHLSTDTGLCSELVSKLPKGSIKVAESGFERGKNVPKGFDAVLIGTGLIREFKLNNNLKATINKIKEKCLL